MTAKEKIEYEKTKAYVKKLENELYELRCDVGDFADGVCELKWCKGRGESIDSAITALITMYDRKRHQV